MNKLFYLIITFILTIFFSCSKKNNLPKPDSINIDKLETEIINDDSTDVIIELITNESENSINKYTSIVNESTMINDSLMVEEEPQFFQLEKKIENILIKISFLEKQLLLKDSAPLSINYTNELKNLIDGPRIKHQISLKNESIIEGFIEEDTEENILIMTSLGKLRIDKDEIASVCQLPLLCMLRGKSPRGDHGHVIVAEIQSDLTFKPVFDPHPDNRMLDVNEHYGWMMVFYKTRN